MDGELLPPDEGVALSQQLASLNTERRRRYGRFVLSALSSIPWVGGLLSATAAFDAEGDQRKVDELQRRWLEEHHKKLAELGRELAAILGRLEELGDIAQRRVEEESYLKLVEPGFRVWDSSATREKKDLIRLLLTNAAGTSLCSDDVVRLFIEWIDRYHEIHFAVIREIHREPGITRGEIWDLVYGVPVRENSAEADLFKLLMRDLSTGGVIRQHRETDYDGRFIRKTPARRPKGTASPYMKSAFDTDEPYELTELGQQFVHYALSDIVPRLSGESKADATTVADSRTDG